jgi:hypothetical protein
MKFVSALAEEIGATMKAAVQSTIASNSFFIVASRVIG